MPAFAQDPGTATLPDSLMAPGTKVVWVKKLAYYCEGAVVDKDGTLYFDQHLSNNELNWPVWKINPSDLTDTGSVFLLKSDQANGMMYDKDWNLVMCQNKKITRFAADGTPTVLDTSGNGITYGQANDLSISSTGAMYFTDLGTNIYYRDATGKSKTVYTNARSANGLDWIEEKNELYVHESGYVKRYQVAADGSISNPTNFAPVSNPDGGCIDRDLNSYVANYSEGKFEVFNAAGTKLGEILISPTGNYDVTRGVMGNADNCDFGGPDGQTIYMTGDGGAYSLHLKIPGRRIPGQASASGLMSDWRKGIIVTGKNITRTSGLWIGGADGVRFSHQGIILQNLNGRQIKAANDRSISVVIAK